MAEQTKCPECSELVTSVKVVRVNPSNGKPLNWFVRLVIGGLLLIIGLLWLLALVVMQIKGDYLWWSQITGIIFFLLPGLWLTVQNCPARGDEVHAENL